MTFRRILVLSLAGLLLTPLLRAQEKGGKATPFSWNAPLPEGRLESMRLPAGLSHRTFRSESMGLEVGYYLYLPPGYDESGERTYPVVFHLHGGRPGGEAKSVSLVRFVDEAIKAGEIQPTIYVFPNGGPMSWYNYPGIENGRGEDVFVKELILHLRETFRTRELAIEGFSQGGRGTTRILLRYPELFVSAAPGGSGYGPEKTVQENGGAESETVVFTRGDNTWDLAEAYAKRSDKERLPILIWVGTKCFNHEFNLLYSDFLTSLGIPHEKLIIEGVEHSAQKSYEKNGMDVMKFHQKFFAAPSPW